LRLRRDRWVGARDLEWLDSQPGTLAFRRGDLECRLSSADGAWVLPDKQVLLESTPGCSAGGLLQPDSAVWLA